jgi:NAD-dependent DNA ligase
MKVAIAAQLNKAFAEDLKVDAELNPDEMNALFFGSNKKLAKVAGAGPDLTDKVIVLTGRPPKPYYKSTFEQMLKDIYHVKRVDSSFSKETQVVIYSPEQNTNKLNRAKEVGLETYSYDEILRGAGATNFSY